MRKQILYTPLTETSAAVTDRINVSDIEGLYEAVNNPAYAGKTIVLAQGKYSLSDKDPNGQDYPNKGRLDLQHNMSLEGEHGHPELVVIDVTALPLSSYTLLPLSQVATAPIRVGNGDNRIEWLTVKNDPANVIRVLIQTDFVTGTTTKIRVAHTILEGASIGLCLINRYTECNNRMVEAEIEDNEIRNNIAASGTSPRFRSGIQIQNSHNVSDAVIKATLNNNYIHDNGNGISVFNAAPGEGNHILIKSNEDRIEDNGVGLAFRAGGNNNAGNIFADDNFIRFEAKDGSIKNNMGTPMPFTSFLPGGVFAAAAMVVSPGVAGSLSHNKLKIFFKDCLIENNTGQYQINAYGAYSASQPLDTAGSNNTNEIHLHGISQQATYNAIDSSPDESAGTNRVTVHS